MGSGKGAQTIGFWYEMTLLGGDCRGPVNEYIALEADKKIAWVGSTADETPIAVNKPDLFGGEKKEGGIQGAFSLFQGARDQVLPGATGASTGGSEPLSSVTLPDIKTAIGGRVSEFRGFVTWLFRGVICAMNPYPKEWHWCRWRTTAGWFGGTAWYPEKATICLPGDGHALETEGQVTTANGIFGNVLRSLISGLSDSENVRNTIRAMNPAHIIYQCLTDPEWGASRPTAEIDENSFILAANTLCSEGFGLCFNWARQEDVDTFIQTVIDHITAVLYTDRETGKIVLRLVRDDYDPDTVPLYDANSGLLEVEDDDSAAGDEAINEVIVKGKDQSIAGMGADFESRAHNVSARQAEGTFSQTIEYPGIPTRALAVRVAQRELRVYASGLKRFKLKFDRRAWKLVPGAVIRIAAPGNDISNIILRIGEVDHGDTEDSTIEVRAMEDVFGMPASSFQSPTTGTWTPPDQTPIPPAATRLLEGGYRDIVLKLGTTDTQGLDPTTAYIGELAKSASAAYQYDLLSRVTGEPSFVDRAIGSFTSAAELSADIAPLDTSITVIDAAGITAAHVGQAVICENEIMRLDGVSGSTLTVARGCADTIPADHADGVLIWLLDDDLVTDGREYVSGETVETKALTRTTSALLAQADAVTDSVDVVARHYKPYPPGDVQIDGDSIYALSGEYAAPVLTFTDRDRLLEDDQLVEHEAGSVGPEAGTTYRVRVKTADGVTLLRTEDPVTSGWTYDGTMQTADGDPDAVLIELESVRDATASWQMYSFVVQIRSPSLRLSGDMTDGDDLLLLSGDMTGGSDHLDLSGDA